ncbi:hypothetical protein Ga0100231_003765 [Opitutaceae bacterium TAV4]|nr:hypothetical protein Ga0100231_003765 [Opitutaceae bacterium TAV4]
MFALATSALLAAFAPVSVRATDYTWINNSATSSTYYWTNTANWSPTGTPGASDNVIFSTIPANNWAARVDSDITVQNVSISNLNKTFDLVPKNGNGNNNSLTITGTLTVSGNTTYLANIRQEEGADHSLSVNVNNITVTNAVLRFGTSINTGTYGRELDYLTSTGTTTLNTGGAILLALQNDATLGVMQFNGGLLALTNSDPTFKPGVSQKVTVAGLNGTSGTIVAAARSADQNGSTNTTAGSTRTGELTVNAAESTRHVFGGVIADKTSASVLGTISLSLVKSGAGIQELSDANTYSGGTTINAGTLLVTNATSATSATGTGVVSVNGGVLAGTGYIAGAVTVANGARLAPGGITDGVSDSGTLTINNALTLADGAILDFNLATANVVGGTGGNDFLQVNGNLSLGASITLNALFSGGLADGVYQILGYTGTLDGSASLASWGVAGLAASQAGVFSFDTNSVYLTVSSVPEPATVGLLAGAVILIGAAIVRLKKSGRSSSSA